MSKARQKKKRARLAHLKRERERRNMKARQHQRFADLGIKTQSTVARSLEDLLPDADAYQVDPDGKIRINMKCKRGAEKALLADIAKRLNIPVDALECVTTKKGNYQ